MVFYILCFIIMIILWFNLSCIFNNLGFVILKKYEKIKNILKGEKDEI